MTSHDGAETAVGGSGGTAPGPADERSSVRHLDRLLVDEARVIVVHVDAVGKIDFVNPFFGEYTGHRLADLAGLDWFTAVVPERHRERARDRFVRAMSSGGSSVVCGRVLTRAGEERGVEWHEQVETDSKGAGTGMLAVGIDISHRRASDEEFRRRAEQLRTAERIAKLGSWVRDRVKDSFSASEGMWDVLEWTPDQLSLDRETFLGLTHPDDREMLKAAHRRLSFERTPFTIRHRVVTPGGHVKWVLQRFDTEFGDDGTPAVTRGILQDITGRQEIEEDLRQFRATLDETLDCVFMFDAETLGFIYVNRGAIEQVGYERDELLEMHIFDVNAEYSEADFRDLLAPILAGDRDRVTVETTHRHRNGEAVPVEMAMQLVASEGSRSRFVAVTHPLTQRQLLQQLNLELEERVQERTAELAEREGELRSAQRIARLGQWWESTGDAGWEWSEGLYHVFGLDPATTIPGRDAFVSVLHPDDAPFVGRRFARVRATGEPERFDFRIVHSDGAVRWIQQEVMVEQAGGAGTRLSGTILDVTERKQVEGALIEAREEAERANLAKSEFLSHMSHELRTPLNAVLGFAQVLDDGTLSSEHREFVSEIQRAGEHLLEMVNELLDLTRIEAGAIRIDARPIETSVVVAACVATVRPLASQNEVRLDVDLASGGVVVADPVRLRQVLLNLLSNAIKYNRAGGSAHVRCDADGDHVRITVTDTGLGIAAESFGELFTPFARLETTYSGIEGAGIGLALSKRLVEAMDGRIGASSVVGEGSTFWIELPRADRDDPSSDLAEADETAHWKVLCVEDNPSNLRLLERIIGERDEFEMLQTQRGETCLRLASVHRPDLILLDLGLPGIDGYEVLRRLRSQSATASIPVIAISANAMQSEIERAEREGFDDYVTKPFTADHLIDTIVEHLPGPSDGVDR